MGSISIGKYTVLNSKQTKEIKDALKKQYGIEKLDFALLQKDTDIYTITRDIDEVDITELRINSAGLYIGEFRHGEMRLSIEGSQLLGIHAQKNIVEINDDEVATWIRGGTLKRSGENAFVLIKHNKDFLGSGRRKDNVILNFVPKSRRILK